MVTRYYQHDFVRFPSPLVVAKPLPNGTSQAYTGGGKKRATKRHNRRHPRRGPGNCGRKRA